MTLCQNISFLALVDQLNHNYIIYNYQQEFYWYKTSVNYFGQFWSYTQPLCQRYHAPSMFINEIPREMREISSKPWRSMATVFRQIAHISSYIYIYNIVLYIQLYPNILVSP